MCLIVFFFFFLKKKLLLQKFTNFILQKKNTQLIVRIYTLKCKTALYKERVDKFHFFFFKYQRGRTRLKCFALIMSRQRTRWRNLRANANIIITTIEYQEGTKLLINVNLKDILDDIQKHILSKNEDTCQVKKKEAQNG